MNQDRMNKVLYTIFSILTLCVSLSFSQLQAGSADMPQVAMNATGYKVGTWEDIASGIHIIQASTRAISDTSWHSIVNISDVTINAFQPAVGIDNNNNAVIIWVQEDIKNQVLSLYASQFSSISGIWSTPTVLSGIDENVFKNYKLTVNGEGDVVAMWDSYLVSQNTNAVFASVCTTGGTWSTSQL